MLTAQISRGRNSRVHPVKDSSLHAAETQQVKCRDLEMRTLQPLEKMREELLVRKGPDFLCTNSILVHEGGGAVTWKLVTCLLYENLLHSMFDDLLSVFCI